MNIASTNRKGGVGKTTFAIHAAAGLAIKGYRVGLVDTDSQGHSALMLGMSVEDGLFKALIENKPFEDCVQVVPPEQYTTPDNPPRGELLLMSSGMSTYKIPYEIASSESGDDPFLFLEMLERFKQAAGLDVVIIDTNPTMSLFDAHIYMAADGFLYVTENERLSFDGIGQALNQFDRAAQRRRRYLNRETQIVGIVPNKFRASTVLHRENIKDLYQQIVQRYPQQAHLVMQPVTLRIAWAEAATFGEAIYRYAPGGQEAADAWRVTNKIEEALKSWHPIETV